MCHWLLAGTPPENVWGHIWGHLRKLEKRFRLTVRLGADYSSPPLAPADTQHRARTAFQTEGRFCLSGAFCRLNHVDQLSLLRAIKLVDVFLPAVGLVVRLDELPPDRPIGFDVGLQLRYGLDDRSELFP